MVSNQEDKAFFKTFLGVMGLLTLGTIAILSIAIFAGTFDTSNELGRMQLEQERTEQRLQPVGEVRMDGDPAPVTMASGNDAPEAGADDGVARTGSDIYESVCMACHAQGVMNAPQAGDEGVWGQLLSEQGLDGLVESAIQGVGAMPPRGGDSSLSDEDVRNAVTHMLEEAGQSVE